ncbi:Alpha/beta hydrolase fold-3 [Cynara cardunculus var. scolymus]|uniref:Alpha/beta hydrolase fold-3 n=1 Tax=Cynara cardunculus var. scolymus TaxID=59895 RepID=A0A118JVT7_CYNCS|nr:Alpha/beta hydrolase fold-3 [Cynara cardunculus var. scolymus]
MSSADEIMKEVPGLIRVFKDGRIQKFRLPILVPAGVDPSSGVNSKDVVFSPENNIFARLYIPKTTTPNHKLPLVIFFHGGGFIIESAASSNYHNFLSLVVAESNVVVVSVDYRLAPEFPLPVAYEDSWEAIKWVAQHVNGNGPDPWLNEYADLQNIFLAGDSAGGNISHHMAIRIGSDILEGLRFRGAILLHPYFWGKERVGNESDSIEAEVIGILDDLWSLVHPGGSGSDDPLINPGMDPKIAGMGCSKILVCVGGNDFLRERNWYYKQVLEKSGWKGELEVVEDEGEGHVFTQVTSTIQHEASVLKK